MNWLFPLLTALAVLAIYLLRPPPRPIVVPTTYLWQRLADRSRPLRERLRWLISLLLATTIACAIAWALTRSNFFSADETIRPLAIVIDNSATMAARGADGEQRLAAAIDQSKRLADNHQGRVLVADTAGQIASPSWGDSESAKEQLDDLRIDYSREHRFPPLPTGASGIGTATDADSVAAGNAPPIDLHFFTDGIRSFDDARLTQATVHSIFSPASNVGITSFSVRPAPDGQVYAFIEVIHTSDQGNDVQLRLEENSVSRLNRELSMAAGELWSGAVDITGWSSPISASVELLSDDDALAADDQAWLLAPQSQSTRILLLADRPQALRLQLEALPRALIRTLSSTQLYRQSSAPGFWQDFDLMIAEASAPTIAPPIPTWWINPPETPYLATGRSATGLEASSTCREGDEARIASRLAIDWSTAWLRGDLEALRPFASVSEDSDQPAALDEARSEVVCNDLPIMVSGLLNGRRQVLQAFDPFAGEVRPDRTSIALVGAVTSWLRSRDLNLTLGSHRLPANLLVEAGAAGSDFDSYVGTAQSRSVGADQTNSASVWFSIERPGLFAEPVSDSRNEPIRIAVNLLDRNASQINASSLGPSQSIDVAQNPEEVPSSSIPWRLLLLVAFALCLLEWHTYRRRITL